MDVETQEIIARAELPMLFGAIRRALGLSQQQISKLSGISRVQISYYETADSVPTMKTFNKWLSAVTEEIKWLRRERDKLSTMVKDKTRKEKGEGKTT